MKKLYKIPTILVLLLLAGIETTHGITTTWLGTVSTSWNNASNWNLGIPDSTDDLIITSNAPYNLTLTQNRRVNSFTIGGDTLDLGTYTLTTTGVTYFNGGKVLNGNLNISGSLCHFGDAVIDARIEATCGYYHMNGGIFLKPVILVSTGAASTSGSGNCVFEDSLSVTNNGSYYFYMGSTYGDSYTTLTITNNSTHEVFFGSTDTTFISGNLILNNTSTGGIVTGTGNGVTYLASGKTITIGSSGFTNNYLTLKNFYQQGSTSQTLTLTGTAILNLINAKFEGNLTIATPGILLKNSTFNGTTSINRNGTSGSFHCDGGNTFTGPLTLTNSATSGRLRMANTTPDTYLNDVTFNSTNGQDVQIGYTGNNIFEGNITINSNKVVFNTASGKVTFAGGNSQTLNGSYNFPFKKLAINKSANHVTANTTLSVDDSLIFVSGNLITTSSYLLTMKHGSTASGASNSSFVSGPVKKVGSTSFAFPTGNKATYRPLIISAPSLSSNEYIAEFKIDSVGVNTGNRDSTLGNIKRNHFWNLTRSSGTSQVYITLSWDSQCSFDDTTVTVANWNGTKWIDLGKGAFTGSATVGTLTSFLHVQNYNQLALSYKTIPGPIFAGCSNITTATALQACLNGASLGSVLTVTGDIILDGNNLTFPLQVPWGVILTGSTEWWKPGCPLISSTYKYSYSDVNCCNDNPPCPQNCLLEKLFLFEMEDNSAIMNLRIRGGSCNGQDFNNDDMLCGGIILNFDGNPTTSLATVQNCEISCFSYAGIFGKSKIDGVNLVNNYIHKVKGVASTGIGYGCWFQGSLTESTVDFENNIFDDCKAAIDGQGYPTNWVINKCTFSQFFLSEDINRHNDNNFNGYHIKDNGTIFNDHNICYPSTCTDPNCFYNIHCPTSACMSPAIACTSGHSLSWMTNSGGVPIYDVGGATTTITNNIFHRKNKESDSNINLTFPNRDSGVGYGGNSQNGIFINYNTFVSDDDDPVELANPPVGSTLRPNYGGFARIADNYIRACVWQGDLKIKCENNAFSYVPGKPISTSIPQEFTMNLTNNSATASLPFSHTPSTLSSQSYTQVIDVNTAFKLNITPVGSADLTYLIRPNTHSNTLTGGQLISNENYFYNGSYISTSNSGNPIGAYDKAGLYGIDVLALDANSGSTTSTLSPYNFKASSWKHIPVIVKETAEQILYFNIKDTYIETLPPASATNIFKQAYFNDLLIWSEDVADGGDGWEYISIDLDGVAADGTTLIKSVVNTDGTDNIISFSIATGNNTTLVNGEIVRGIGVLIDDVYIKKYGNSAGDNLIRDGSIELSEYGLSNWPPTLDTYCSQTVVAASSCIETISTTPPPTVTKTHYINYNEYISRGERRSGQFALLMTLDHMFDCEDPIYPFPASPTPFLRLTTVGTAIDFTDFLSCSEYSGYSAIDYVIDVTNAPYPNQNLIIDGNVEIISGGTLDLQGCRILVKPHTPPYTITVKSGGTLIMDQFDLISPTCSTCTTYIPTHIFACDAMWGGIINEGGTLNLYAVKAIEGFTKIEDALIAIDSEGGNVQVRYTTFDHNGLGILLDGTNILVNNQSKINGCEFLCTDGAISRSPLAGAIPNEHVILNGIINTNPFALGVSGTGTGTINIFSDAINGVSINNSKVTMQRNEFYRIYRRDEGNLATDYGRAINIRNSGTSINYATTIMNNEFNDVNLGINVDNIIGSDLTINDNTFNNPTYNFDPNPSTVLFYNHRTAIKVQNPIAAPAIKAEIYGNNITNFRIGIHTLNTPEINIGTDVAGTLIAGNTIEFDKTTFPLTNYYEGIWLQNCAGAKVANNSVFNSTENEDLNFRGLDIETSADCFLNCNDIDKIGVAINIYDDCGVTKLRSNTMSNFFTGVWLNGPNGASIDIDQGDAATQDSWGNEWNWQAAPSLKVDGAGYGGAQTNWYYEGSDANGNTFSPRPWNANIVNPIPATGTAGSLCTSFFRTTPNRHENFGPVVGDSAIYAESEDNSRYLATQNSYIAMKNDSTLVFRGDSLDVDFESFFLRMDSSNVGKFQKVRELATNWPDSAKVINALIADSNDIEFNLKTFNTLYFDKLIYGTEMNSTDSTFLDGLLSGSYITVGESFYNAAAAQSREIHPGSYSLRLGSTVLPDPITAVPVPKQAIKIFPNPANSSIKVELLDADDKIILIELYSSLGNLIISKTCNSNLFELNIQSYQEGLYKLRAFTQKGFSDTKTFSIVR